MPADIWDEDLRDGSTFFVLAHARAIEDGFLAFSVLFKGKPGIDVATVRVPVSWVPEDYDLLHKDDPIGRVQSWRMSLRWMLKGWGQALGVVPRPTLPPKTAESVRVLVRPAQYWEVPLRDGASLYVLAHTGSVGGDFAVFRLLFEGDPVVMVETLRIPLSVLAPGYRPPAEA